jgi:Na+/H+ antiporter NhaC
LDQPVFTTEDQQQDDVQGNQDDDYAYNNCRWYQWGCSSNNNYNYQQQDGQRDGQNDEVRAPWWWWFASEEERRRRQEENRVNPSLILTYVWSLVLFCSIVYFGYTALRRNSDLYRVVVALLIYANLSFITMLLIGGLEGVQTEGRELEEQGFYGQFPVMMYMSSFIWVLFSLIYAFIFYSRARRGEKTVIEVDESDYQIHDEPKNKDVV